MRKVKDSTYINRRIRFPRLRRKVVKQILNKHAEGYIPKSSLTPEYRYLFDLLERAVIKEIRNNK